MALTLCDHSELKQVNDNQQPRDAMTTLRTAVFDTKPYDRESLQRAVSNGEIEWRFMDWRLSAETAASAEGARAVCIFVNDRADRACLEALASRGVKHVALRCAGYNSVDIDAATELGLSVTRVPAYSPYAVAEHAVALLLALNRKIPRASNRVHDLNFSLNGLVGFDLHGKTAGILGTGKIGRVAAQILRGFGMKVLAFDVVPSHEWAKEHGVIYTDGRTLARECEVIALKSGRIGGVGLDVYEEEEGVFFEDLSGQILQDDELARLLTFPNVLITAHQAFLTREALAEIARVTVANLVAFATGQPFLPGTTLNAQLESQ